MAKISVIVPVYNVAEYIGACLASIDSSLRAYHGDVGYEVLIVDDASTDGSCDIAQAFVDSHQYTRLIRHEMNKGLAEVRNTGLAEAKGDYVGWVDSDDLVEEKWFSEIADAISSGADIIAFDFTGFSDKGGCTRQYSCSDVLGVPNAGGFVDPKEFAVEVLHSKRIGAYSWAKVFRANFLQGMRYNAPRWVFEDVAFSYEYLPKMQAVYYIPRSLYRYRLRSGGLVGSWNVDRIAIHVDYLLARWMCLSRRFRDAALVHLLPCIFRIISDENDRRVKCLKYSVFLRRHFIGIWLSRYVSYQMKKTMTVCAFQFVGEVLRVKNRILKNIERVRFNA